MAILELNNVSKAYGGTPVLKDITLSIEPGQFVAMLGFSGTGKTTLVNLVAGLAAPDAGSVALQGRVRSPSRARSARWSSSPTR